MKKVNIIKRIKNYLEEMVIIILWKKMMMNHMKILLKEVILL